MNPGIKTQYANSLQEKRGLLPCDSAKVTRISGRQRAMGIPRKASAGAEVE